MRTIQLLFVLMFAATSTLIGQNEAAPMHNANDIYISKQVNGTMDEVYHKVVEALKAEKFGVITEVDMAKTLKSKIDVDIEPYMILGVCHAGSAYKALQAEPNSGVFLPCKVILKQLKEGTIEVVAANPEMMMKMLGNEKLDETAGEVADKLSKVIKSL